MTIQLTSVFGCASIGIYTLATDEILIAPSSMPKSEAEKLGRWLNVEVIHTDIGASPLVGVLACANSNGIILPYIVRDEEVESIRRVWDGNVQIMDTTYTAYGNMVLANDYGAVIDPSIDDEHKKIIGETLDVDVERCTTANSPYVGSFAVATNKGVLAHPMISEEERKVIESILKVPVSVGTVNRGIPYVATGLLCNLESAVAGSLTT
ncbi:MAG: translation initiation factor IF-6, partial [Candidatus Bathyarchaeia archaeon]